MPSPWEPSTWTKEDEERICKLLRGDIPQGSKDGVRAQEALAELLLSWARQSEGPTSEICWALWDLFVSNKPRRVVIKKRNEEKEDELPISVRDWGIATWIFSRIGDGPLTKQVIADAKSAWGNASRGTITRAWKHWGEPLKRQKREEQAREVVSLKNRSES
jgi:hypothetical protein